MMKTPKRVNIIDNELYNTRGWQERSYFDILTQLHQKGHSDSICDGIK